MNLNDKLKIKRKWLLPTLHS